VNRLIHLINRITEFGTNPSVELDDKVSELRKLLVEIYSAYLNLNVEFDENDYDEEPNFEYKNLRKNVTHNFPDFGLYHVTYDSHISNKKADLTMGDSIDDLTDIIKDLLAVKWQIENTSEMNGIWEFDFSMRTHTERHLVNLLKYIKDKTD
jgi:hypothetical protein